jgi:hypothetical protein
VIGVPALLLLALAIPIAQFSAIICGTDGTQNGHWTVVSGLGWGIAAAKDPIAELSFSTILFLVFLNIHHDDWSWQCPGYDASDCELELTGWSA